MIFDYSLLQLVFSRHDSSKINNYKMRNLFLLIILFISSTVVSFAQKAEKSYDISDSIDFMKYKTFDFYYLNESSPAPLNSNEARIIYMQNGITDEMKKRGILQNKDKSELLVNIGIVIMDKDDDYNKKDIDTPFFITKGNYYPYPDSMIKKYVDGTIVIEIVDKNENELIWQGAIYDAIDDNLIKCQKDIHKGAEKLFDYFPVIPVSKRR